MTVFIIALVVVAALAAAAIFAVAYRGMGSEPPPPRGRLSRRTRAKDRGTAAPAAEPEPAPDPGAPEPAEPLPDPLTEREEISAREYDMTRRSFLARTAAAVFGLVLVQVGIGALAYMWPKLRGGFGTKIDAGDIADLKSQMVAADGTVVPVFVSAAQAWVVPFAGNLADSSFEGLPVVADGVMALWQRCVHLGCRVPECNSSQGFECPCHGSKYNYHGEFESGPAPRNMDRFAVEVDKGKLIIDTGAIIQTARSRTKTAVYPQGPSCITGGEEHS